MLETDIAAGEVYFHVGDNNNDSSSCGTYFLPLKTSNFEFLSASQYEIAIEPLVNFTLQELADKPYIIHKVENFDNSLKVWCIYKVAGISFNTKTIFDHYNNEFLIAAFPKVNLIFTGYLGNSSQYIEYKSSTLKVNSAVQLDLIFLSTDKNLKLITEKEFQELKQQQDNLYKEMLAEKLKYIILFEDVAKSFFGEDNVYLDNSSINNINLIIKFPIIDISNKDKFHHIIQDLYIKLEFKENFKLRGVIRGIRGIRSQAEHDSYYMHSHLPTYNIPTWANFCLGDTELYNCLIELSDVSEYTIEHIEAFMLLLEQYLSYESLEGGPYCDIRRINVKSKLTPLSDVYYCAEKVWYKFIEQEEKFEFMYRSYNSLPSYDKIIISNLELQLLPYIAKENLVTKFQAEYVDLDSNDAYSKGATDIKLFDFKGNPVYYTIISGKKNEEEENIQKYPHPQITQYVEEKLISEFTEFLHCQSQANNSLVSV